MKYRQVLLAIRENREKELKELEKIYSEINSTSHINGMNTLMEAPHIQPLNFFPTTHVDALIKKRLSILTLELPFKTDTLSIGTALQRSQEASTDNQASILQKIYKWRNCGTRNQQYSRNYIVRLITEEICPKSVLINFDSQGNRIINPPLKTPLEEIGYILSPEIILDAVNRKISNPRSRAVLKSLIKDLFCFLNPQEADLHKNTPKDSIPLNLLACYFEHLEQRCLKAKKNDRPYRNLLELRLLLYVPLPCTQLNKLTLKDLATGEIKGYPLPSSFVELTKALFSDEKPLLKRSAKQLGRFIDQSAIAAKLEGEIKLKKIQRSLKTICKTEGYFTEYLPRR